MLFTFSGMDPALTCWLVLWASNCPGLDRLALCFGLTIAAVLLLQCLTLWADGGADPLLQCLTSDGGTDPSIEVLGLLAMGSPWCPFCEGATIPAAP